MTLVAVLERNGRFLTAAPLFPPRERNDGPRRSDSGRIVVRSTRAKHGGETARAGDLVLVSAPARGGKGVQVLRLLGRPDVARDVIEALMLDRGLRRSFAEAVEVEARSAAARAERSDGSRRDLRGLATFTIDPATARDFDDAVSAEGLGGEDTRVWVHIADVTAHVIEGSALDREAQRRATSVYVPGAVEPMLPHALSSHACSLVPGEDRRAVTVEMVLRGAETTEVSFYRSLIRSDARLDYEQVDRIFDGREAAAEPWRAPLQAARQAAAALQRERERAGGLAIDSHEPEFVFDRRGNVTEVRGRAQTESHRLIEHLMIAANEAVARLLSRSGVPCLYRVHERPEPTRIERLIEQLASLDVPTPPQPERMSASQAAELLGAISMSVAGHVRRAGQGGQALNRLVLRSLKQAYYSPQNLGHAGLHSTAYCHFTSPIRRYPDIVCHRALLSAVGGGERAPRASELVELGAATSEREREAMIIERDADDVARCFALERLIYELGDGEMFSGEITGLIGAGAFIAFDQADAAGPDSGGFEGMMPVRFMRAPEEGRAERGEQGAGGRREADGRGARDRGAPGRAVARGASSRGATSRGATSRGASGRGPGGRGRGGTGGRGDDRGGPREPGGERDWWELNEEGTILFAQRSGAAIRLGDAIDVRVARIDVIRGRVDLQPAH
ncbi:MAG TPA: RNB domain-containing ribonuclease [Solirubrobacteraceae bacterium]|nr:RNB domain-containing ribonuclease [Solirubrobacteraceae bacterium]